MDNTALSPRACMWVITPGPGRKPGGSLHTRRRLSRYTSLPCRINTQICSWSFRTVVNTAL